MNREWTGAVAGAGSRRRFLAALSSAVIVVGLPLLVVAYVAMWLDAFTTLLMHDYGREYFNLARWLDGGTLYSTDPGLVNFVPPVVHVLYLPFAVLPAYASYVAWLGVNLALLLWVCGRVLDDLAMPVKRSLILAGVVFASAPLTTGAYTGQPIGFLALLGWTVSRKLRTDQHTAAGVALGVLAAWKPTFALVAAAFLVAGRIRTALVAGLTTIALMLLGVALFGTATTLAWYRQIGLVAVYPSRMNVSVYGLFYRALVGGFNFAPLTVAPVLVAPLAALASVPILWRAIPVLRHERDADRLCSVAVTAASLLFPIAWTYYLPALLPSFARHWSTQRPSLVWLCAVALMLVPFPLTWLGQPSALGTVTIGSSYCWSMCLLLYSSTERAAPAS